MSKRSANKMCRPVKRTRTANGKEYTYFEIKYTVGYDPKTGKQIQKSIYGKTQGEVVDKYHEALREDKPNVTNSGGKMTVKEWLETWLTDYCRSIAPRTLDSYTANCRNHLIPALGEIRLDKLRPLDIQRSLNTLCDAKTGKPLSAKTVKNIHGTLHRALERARLIGYISKNPADSDVVELPRVIAPEINAFEDDEVTALLTALEKDNGIYKNPLELALFAGLREGEVLGLNWKSVDFKNKCITIKQQLQRNRQERRYEIVPTKSKRTRVIAVPDYVLELLRAERERQRHNRKKAGKLWNNEWNLVFTREDGSNMSAQSLYLYFKEIARSIGCGDKRVHDLRHTYATMSLSAGDDIKTVQDNLGHATAAFTLRTYAHATKKMKRNSADNMGAYIEKVLPDNQ